MNIKFLRGSQMELEQLETVEIISDNTIIEENRLNCELNSVLDMSGWREADD